MYGCESWSLYTWWRHYVSIRYFDSTLVTGDGGILACHISTRAAFICRAFTGIIILSRCVGRWAEGHSECSVWICTCRTSTCNEQRVCGGRKKNSFFKYESKANSTAKQCKQKRTRLKWKTGTAVGSDQIYGCATVWRHSCAAYGRSELEKKFLERPLDKVSKATAWRTNFISSGRGRSTDWVIDTGRLLPKMAEHCHSRLPASSNWYAGTPAKFMLRQTYRYGHACSVSD